MFLAIGCSSVALPQRGVGISGVGGNSAVGGGVVVLARWANSGGVFKL